MPKLTTFQRTKGLAIAALLKLYMTEPEFVKELEEIRTTHSAVLEQWLSTSYRDWTQVKENLTPEEFDSLIGVFFSLYQAFPDNLANKLESLISTPDPKLESQIEAYFQALTDLAYKWKLRASWAGISLNLHYILENTIYALPEEAEIPEELFESWMPPIPIPPLKFEVKAFELMFRGRQEIQDKFAKVLSDYENKLRSLGWVELPTSIESHAFWWFEHYVHGIPYHELENQQVTMETIKRAVWKFSKLLGIRVK